MKYLAILLGFTAAKPATASLAEFSEAYKITSSTAITTNVLRATCTDCSVELFSPEMAKLLGFILAAYVFVEFANPVANWLEDYFFYKPRPPAAREHEHEYEPVSAPPVLTFSPSTQFERKTLPEDDALTTPSRTSTPSHMSFAGPPDTPQGSLERPATWGSRDTSTELAELAECGPDQDLDAEYENVDADALKADPIANRQNVNSCTIV